jgi:hypothetical protein
MHYRLYREFNSTRSVQCNLQKTSQVSVNISLIQTRQCSMIADTPVIPFNFFQILFDAYKSQNTKELQFEICALLGYYAPSGGNPLPTFRDNALVPSSSVKMSLTLEDGTDTLYPNVGKGLPLDAA